MLTIEPLISRSIIEIATCLVFRNVPSPATPTARFQNSRHSSSTPRPPSSAALLIRMSIRPQRVEHLTDVAHDVVLGAHVADDRHRLTAVALDPPDARLGRLGETSLHATRAPYRARASAIPLPMFGPAP